MLPMVIFSDITTNSIIPQDMLKNLTNINNSTDMENLINKCDNCKSENIITRPTCTLKLPKNDHIQTDFVFVIYGIFISFLISTVYICVLQQLSQRKHKNLSTSTDKEKTRRKVTNLVLAVVGVYLGTRTPFWINQIAIVTYYSVVVTPTSEVILITMTRLSTIFQILLSLNSALNPYLYAFLGKAFRENFQKVFQCLISKCTFKKDLDKTIARSTPTQINNEALELCENNQNDNYLRVSNKHTYNNS